MRKKALSVALSAAMALSMTPIPAFAATDDQGHWAEPALDEWQGYGVIQGYADGSVRPDAPVTRAELATMLDRAMGYQAEAENTFTDLAGHWGEGAMLRAVAAGVFHGDGEGDSTVRPDDPITREEAALVLSRVLDLDAEAAPDAGFADSAEVSPWADAAVDAMAAGDYVNGYADGTFRPKEQITRAETVTILDNAFAALYSEAGEYTGDVDGSAIVKADGVVLKDMTIKGDLVIAEGVGEGHVELQNVTVEGRLIVRGGGENSVLLRGATRILGDILVDRLAGAVRIAAEAAAQVGKVVVSEAAEGLRLEGDFGALEVEGAQADVTVAGSVQGVDIAEGAEGATVTVLEGASAGDVAVSAPSAQVVVEGTADSVSLAGQGAALSAAGSAEVGAVAVSGAGASVKAEGSASVESVAVSSSASDVAVEVAGSATVGKVETAAAGTEVTVASDAEVEEIVTSGTGTTVSGEGTVGSVTAEEGSSDVTVSTEGTDVENNGEGDVAIEGGTIPAGESGTTPGGTTQGGGSTGGTVTPPPAVHTHTYVDGVCAADGAYDPAWAQVDTLDEWNAAVEAGKSIVIVNNFETASQLRIDRPVTINGNGKTITASESWTGSDNDSKHLLLIIDEAGAAAADNVSIKNLTLDSNNKAYGAQAYCVNGAVFENVTLQNSVGAGLTVNSSSVEAKGLKTTGNAWGGVNADNNVEGESTKFTFDATSTFAEQTAVYSDEGDVAVTAPEGWARGIYTTITADPDGKPGSGDETTDKTYVWAKYFAGGMGTAESPYTISNLNEWKNLSYVATGGLSFELTTDIALNSTESMLPQFIGTLDGGNHTITLPEKPASSSAWVAFAESATGTIRNLVIEHGTGEVIPFVAYAVGDNLTFDNVDICTSGAAKTCKMADNDNNESAYLVQSFASSLAFKNCDNYLSYYHDGGSNMYTSAFLGGYATGTGSVTFDNCWNYGDLQMSHASLFIGNGSNMGQVTVSVSNSGNYGQIIGYESAKPFAAISTDALKDSESLNNVEYNGNGGAIFTLQKLEGLGLSLDDDGTIVISAPGESADVASYNLTFAAYGKTNDATYLFNVILPIGQAGDTNHPRYHMVDVETARGLGVSVDGLEYTGTGNSGMKYAISGEYLVCDFGDYAENVILNNANPTVSVSAVNSEGNVIGYAKL